MCNFIISGIDNDISLICDDIIDINLMFEVN